MLAVGLANLFIGLVLVGVGYSLVRRIVVRPTRLALSRDAFVILALILAVVTTELIGDAMQYVAHPEDPGRRWRSWPGLVSGAGTHRSRCRPGLVRAVRLAAHRLRAGLRRVSAVQQAPAHPDQRAERLLPQPGAARRPAQDGPGGGATARRGAGLRCQDAPGPVLASAGWPVLHRVRPLHGVLPGQPDRQDTQPEALHGGAARPDRDGETALSAAASAQRAAKGGANGGWRPPTRHSAWPANERPMRCRCRWSTTRFRKRRSGSARPAAGAWRAARSDRARRLDRRDPPQPGAGGRPSRPS